MNRATRTNFHSPLETWSNIESSLTFEESSKPTLLNPVPSWRIGLPAPGAVLGFRCRTGREVRNDFYGRFQFAQRGGNNHAAVTNILKRALAQVESS